MYELINNKLVHNGFRVYLVLSYDLLHLLIAYKLQSVTTIYCKSFSKFKGVKELQNSATFSKLPQSLSLQYKKQKLSSTRHSNQHMVFVQFMIIRSNDISSDLQITDISWEVNIDD